MHKFFHDIWYFICRFLLIRLSDQYFITFLRRIQYFRLGFKYYPVNWLKPITFSDRINSIKIKPSKELSTIVADKVLVRAFVEKKIGKQYLIPLIGVFSSTSELDWDLLPSSFILKANHGSGWNILVKDKSLSDEELVKNKLDVWLKRNAYYLSREKQYRSITPKIICEQLIDNEPNDYKFFCFYGQPKLIQVDHARFSNHRRTLFDLNWNKVDIHIRYPEIENDIPKPYNLHTMIELAKVLSGDFEFSRIDLYEVNNRVYFGEITLFPGGGAEPFFSYDEDLLMGSYFEN